MKSELGLLFVGSILLVIGVSRDTLGKSIRSLNSQIHHYHSLRLLRGYFIFSLSFVSSFSTWKGYKSHLQIWFWTFHIPQCYTINYATSHYYPRIQTTILSTAISKSSTFDLYKKCWEEGRTWQSLKAIYQLKGTSNFCNCLFKMVHNLIPLS